MKQLVQKGNIFDILPMLATGGSAEAAITMLKQKGSSAFAPPTLEYFSPKDIWKIKGLFFACLVACFLYVTYLTQFSFAFPAIVVLISTIELGCRLLGGKAKGMRLESAILMVTSLLQGLQISLLGLHDNWGSA